MKNQILTVQAVLALLTIGYRLPAQVQIPPISLTEEGDLKSAVLNQNELFNCPIDFPIAKQQDYFDGFAGASDLDAGLVFADNFNVTTPSEITQVCWYGSYFGGDGNATDQFTVTYYDNNIDIPGNIIGGPFTVTNLKKKLSDIGEGVYGYYTNHQPVSVSPGNIYWISIVNNTAGDSDTWGWSISTDYLVDPDIAVDIGLGFESGNWACSGGPCYGNMFCLGPVDPIPTVSQWGLLILGLMMIIVGSVVIKEMKTRAVSINR